MTRAGTWGPIALAAALTAACGNGAKRPLGRRHGNGRDVLRRHRRDVTFRCDRRGRRRGTAGPTSSASTARAPPTPGAPGATPGGGRRRSRPRGGRVPHAARPARRLLGQGRRRALADLGVHGASCPTGDPPTRCSTSATARDDPAGFPALEAVEPPGDRGRPRGAARRGPRARGAPPVVRFSGATAQVLFAFPDAVWVVVPAGLPVGLVDVTVSRSGLESPAVPFTVTAPRTPVLESITRRASCPARSRSCAARTSGLRSPTSA